MFLLRWFRPALGGYQALDRAPHPRVDLQGAPKPPGGLARVARAAVAQPAARQRAEVARLPPQHLTHVGERRAVVAEHVVRGRALVPRLRPLPPGGRAPGPVLARSRRGDGVAKGGGVTNGTSTGATTNSVDGAAISALGRTRRHRCALARCFNQVREDVLTKTRARKVRPELSNSKVTKKFACFRLVCVYALCLIVFCLLAFACFCSLVCLFFLLLVMYICFALFSLLVLFCFVLFWLFLFVRLFVCFISVSVLFACFGFWTGLLCPFAPGQVVYRHAPEPPIPEGVWKKFESMKGLKEGRKEGRKSKKKEDRRERRKEGNNKRGEGRKSTNQACVNAKQEAK